MFEKDSWYAMRPTGNGQGGACLVIDSEDNVLLVNVYRHALDEVSLEIPRGFGDPDVDFSSMETALREATEETGINLDDAEVVDLGEICPDSGILAVRVRLVAAVLSHPMPTPRIDPSEVQSATVIPLDSLRKMAARGEIVDAFTLAAIFRLDAHRNNLTKSETTIEIMDSEGCRVRCLKTRRPQWSFDQYCRNRKTAGWSWRKLKPGKKAPGQS